MSPLLHICLGAGSDASVATGFLLVQGIGALLLVTLCGILYTARWRRYFLYWSLALLCAALWRLGLSVLQYGPEVGLPDSRRGLLAYLTGLVGLWHVALWGLGFLGYRERQRRWPVEQDTGDTLARAIISGRVALAVLLVAALADTVLALVLSWSLRQQLISAVAALVYAASAVWFARRRLWPVNLLLSGMLTLFALANIADALQLPGTATAAPAGVEYAALRDSVLLALLAVGMILVLLSADIERQLRQANQELSESEERLRLLFERSGVGLALLSPDGFFLESNPAVTEVLGYPAEELRGRRIGDLTHPDDRTSSAVLAAVGGRRDSEKRFVHKDGREVRGRLVRVAIHGARGQVLYHVAALIDVNQQHQIEPLTTLLGSVAEQLNNQLTAVLGNLHLLLSDLQLPSESAPPEFLARQRHIVAAAANAEKAARKCAERTAELLACTPGLTGGAPPTSSETTALAAPPAAADVPASPAQASILIVDDEPVVRDLARTVLERAGFVVQTASDGDDALRLHHEHGDTIDLVLLDYSMPGRTGLQVLCELRRLQPNVRVIFSSGCIPDGEMQQCLDAGVLGFVPKPYRPQDLVEQVRRALRDRS
jgi:PAS domain S-box-containing protein